MQADNMDRVIKITPTCKDINDHFLVLNVPLPRKMEPVGLDSTGFNKGPQEPKEIFGNNKSLFKNGLHCS